MVVALRTGRRHNVQIHVPVNGTRLHNVSLNVATQLVSHVRPFTHVTEDTGAPPKITTGGTGHLAGALQVPPGSGTTRSWSEVK